MTNPLQRRDDLRRRVAAIAVGGVLIGVGVSGTVAAWTDNVWAAGTFTASTKDIQISPDGATWAQATTDASAVTLTMPSDAGSLGPGTSVFFPAFIKLTNSSASAAVVLAAVQQGAGLLDPALEYRMRGLLTDTATLSSVCSAGAFGTDTWIAGNASTYLNASTATPPTVASQTLTGTVNQVLHVCVEVRMKANADMATYAGTTDTLKWQFSAT